MDTLYYAEGKDVSATANFDAEVLKTALRNIYERRFNPMSDIEANLFQEFWKKLNFATDIGIEGAQEYISRESDFYEALRENNGVFAAFKVHRMQNDMAALLLDSNGVRKPFKQWLKDVAPIANHQVYTWFETEYTTAINRAHQAADWKRFERDADVLPNLEWMPSTAPHPREMHMAFYGLILPIHHPFWTKHRPGDSWNCQCDLEATDAERTPEEQIPGYEISPAKGLDNNPAEDAKLFSESHPYYPTSCENCAFKPESGKSFKNLFFGKGETKKDCSKCQKIKELIKNLEDERYLAKRWIKEVLALIENGHIGKRSINIGTVPVQMKDYALNNNIDLFDETIILLDKQIAHALRADKIERGQAITNEQMIGIRENMEKADIYFDRSKNNFVFVCREEGQMFKYIIQPNYKTKTNGKKVVGNFFITAGKIKEGDLNNGIYKKIK